MKNHLDQLFFRPIGVLRQKNTDASVSIWRNGFELKVAKKRTFENSSRETSAGQRDSADQLEVSLAAEGEAVDRDLVRAGVPIGDVPPDVGRQSLAHGRLSVGQEDDALKP